MPELGEDLLKLYVKQCCPDIDIYVGWKKFFKAQVNRLVINLYSGCDSKCQRVAVFL